MERISTLLKYLARLVFKERGVALLGIHGPAGAKRLECAGLPELFSLQKAGASSTHSKRFARSSDFENRPVLWNFFVVAGLFAMVVAGVVFYLFDPETAGFFPLCSFHQLTGLQCPGCGSLRALHQLTHGNIAAAWRFNPLLLAMMPLAAWLALREWVRLAFGWRWPGIITRPIVGWSLVVVTVVFGIARNLR